MIAANESSWLGEYFKITAKGLFFMKKHFKFRRLGSFVLAAMMALCLCVPALAAEGASRITYDVFQIFTGQYANSESGSQGAGDLGGETLSNVKWGQNGKLPAGAAIGDAVDDAILAELDALVNKDENGNATDQGEQNTGDVNRKRLEVIKKYVDLESAPLHAAVASIDDVKALTLDNGYYLVRVTPGSVSGGEVYPTYTVAVLNNHIENFKPKGLEGGVPSIDKKTGDGTNSKSDAAIGDVVQFTITSTLPTNLHDYYEYFWAVTDTMSEGLTWAAAKGVDANSAGVVSAKIDDTDVTNILYVGAKAADGKILMGFQNILAIKDGSDAVVAHDGSVVTIVYQAIVNDKAKIASDANTNEVKLEYSHDPNHSGDGTTPNDPDNPPTPKPDNPTGGTVEGENTKTQTWITGLTVEHFNTKGTPLTGSEFKLTGDDINTTIKYTSNFRAPAEGETATYYKLKNGSYTRAAPVTEGEGKNDDQYESTTAQYVREDVLVTVNETPTEVVATIDDNGCLTITGLKSGTYKLQNTKIPNGYNLAEDIDFVISFDETNLFSSSLPEIVQERTPEWFYVTIIAGAGSLLPETGGAGVYFLYGGGIALLIAAVAVVVIRNKKKSAEK